jgi:hypothetical protein
MKKKRQAKLSPRRKLPNLDLSKFGVTAYQLAATGLFSVGTAVELLNGGRKNPTLSTLTRLAQAITEASNGKPYVRVRDLIREE